MIACTLLSGALAATHLVPVQHITSARQFGKVAVLALVFCLSVVLGNISLRYIPVSFNQVCANCDDPASTVTIGGEMLAQLNFMRGTLAAKGGQVKECLPNSTQAIGATTPLCTAGLAFAMLGLREPRRVYLTLIPVVAGVVLATGELPHVASVHVHVNLCISTDGVRGLARHYVHLVVARQSCSCHAQHM